MGAILTLMAFIASWSLGRRSLGAGMAVVLTAGYFFGIIRANYPNILAFFLYDAAVIGLYLARLTLPNALSPRWAKALGAWVWVLIGWPIIMVVLCALFPQHPLIQLVGLRGAIWYLPFLLLGASALPEDLSLMARALAVLNILTLVFAAGEFFLGLERFYPKNQVTALIYRCSDVAGSTAYRIPATFSSSAGYGSTMIATVAWLIGRWQMSRLSFLERCLFGGGLISAMLGAFLCGSRMPVVLLFVLGAAFAYHFRTRIGYLVLGLGLALFVGYVVSGNARLQRFTTLQDTEYLETRIGVSMHLGILDIMSEYPLGAGLGSAFGTNIPTFLLHLVDKPPIGVENEYARIGVEQGFIGIGIWLAFLVWLFVRRRETLSPAWKFGLKMMFVHTVLCWVSATIGCGLLLSIPTAAVLLFQMGVLAQDRRPSVPVRATTRSDVSSINRRRGNLQIPERENKPCLFPG